MAICKEQTEVCLRIMVLNEVQPLKASPLILRTEEGISKRRRFLQSEKAPLAISSKLFPCNLTDSKEEQ